MFDPMPAGVLALVLVPVVVVIVVAVLASVHVLRSRRRALEELARAWGWSFQDRAPQLDGRWRGRSFSSVVPLQAHFVLNGEVDGRQVAVLEYRAPRQIITTVVVALPRALPDIEFTPRGAGARIAATLGATDVEVGHPAVDQRWRISTDRPQLARDLVSSPPLAELLATGPLAPLRLVGGDAISWRNGSIKPHAVSGELAHVLRAVDLVPPQVWRDYGYDPHAGAGGTPGT